MTDQQPRDELDWQAWEVDDLPESFADDVLDAIDAGAPADVEIAVVEPEQTTLPRRGRGWLVVATATVAAAAAVTLLWRGTQPTPSPAREAPVAVAAFNGVGVTTENDSAQWRWLSTSERSAVAEQTAGRVRWDAQRGVPLTVQTPAGRVSTNRADFTLEVLDMSLSITQLVGGTVAAGTVATLIYLHAGDAELSNDEGTMTATAPRRAAMSDEQAPRLVSEPSDAPKVAKKDVAEQEANDDWNTAKIGIVRALSRKSGGPPPKVELHATDDGEDIPMGTLPKEYIRETVKDDVFPLVKECYNNVLEDKPALQGKLTMQFTIMGDESVGGIVDELTFAEDSDIDDEAFRECVGQSMMSTVFDPPEGGGKVVVTYPFKFVSSGNDDTPPADESPE